MSNELQLENLLPSASNTRWISSHPAVVTAAPNNVTGSLCDHMAIRSVESPLWRAFGRRHSWQPTLHERLHIVLHAASTPNHLLILP